MFLMAFTVRAPEWAQRCLLEGGHKIQPMPIPCHGDLFAPRLRKHRLQTKRRLPGFKMIR